MILRKKLKLQGITACWVSHCPTRNQRDHYIKICCEWLKIIEDEPDVIRHVTTGDESWIHHSDPATKLENMHWKSLQSPVERKVNRVKSMNNVILILFFDSKRAVYQHIVPCHISTVLRKKGQSDISMKSQTVCIYSNFLGKRGQYARTNCINFYNKTWQNNLCSLALQIGLFYLMNLNVYKQFGSSSKCQIGPFCAAPLI